MVVATPAVVEAPGSAGDINYAGDDGSDGRQNENVKMFIEFKFMNFPVSLNIPAGAAWLSVTAELL